MPKPRNPRTHREWQEAADAAEFMLLVDSARVYGLISGGPKANHERCQEILDGAKRRGITPREPLFVREALTHDLVEPDEGQS